MNHLKYRGLGISLSQKRRRMHNVVLVTFIAIVAIVLASCGSPAAGQSNQASPAPTITVVPSNTPTTAPALTPTSTPKPTTSPQATVTPTQPAAPAILDVRPSSMSIVGHLDCNRASTYVCLARVLSRADAQSDLHWTAFTNVPGNIGFSPASGVLAPGQSVLITITIPFNACTPGLFFFRGPVNTHTITWAC